MHPARAFNEFSGETNGRNYRSPAPSVHVRSRREPAIDIPKKVENLEAAFHNGRERQRARRLFVEHARAACRRIFIRGRVSYRQNKYVSRFRVEFPSTSLRFQSVIYREQLKKTTVALHRRESRINGNLRPRGFLNRKRASSTNSVKGSTEGERERDREVTRVIAASSLPDNFAGGSRESSKAQAFERRTTGCDLSRRARGETESRRS